MHDNTTFDPDRARTSENKPDELGFGLPAKRVAEAIHRLNHGDGFVFGLEGEWGSGKTSFLNDLVREIAKLENPPEIVRFSPWLIRARDGMMRELFHDLALASTKIDLKPEPPTPGNDLIKIIRAHVPWKRSASRRRLVDQMRRYAGLLGILGRATTVADLVVTGGTVTTVATNLASSSTALRELGASPSLDAEKQSLAKELGRLTRPILVVIDDLDRLEPAEAAEVVRLVRAIADFPNVTYLMSYSREVLVESLRNAFHITNPDEFLEKIVQLTFQIPKPEDFDLRRMLARRIEASSLMFGYNEADAQAAEARRRLSAVIDLEGGRTLTTPRMVVRVMNAILLYATPVLDRIDLADMVWLQMIRLKNPTLYRWIENYVNVLSAMYVGASVGRGDEVQLASKLKHAMTGEDDNDDQFMAKILDLGRVLPFIVYDMSSKSVAVLKDFDRNRMSRNAKQRRLASPSHFRYYFALSKPANALAEEELDAFFTAVGQSPDDAIASLNSLATEARPQGGTLVDALLDRLTPEAVSLLSAEKSKNLVLALAASMDVAAAASRRGEFNEYWIWAAAERIFFDALREVRGERDALLRRVFEYGASISWLADIFRSEWFKHGRVGDQSTSADLRNFTEQELDLISEILAKRFRADDSVVLHALDLTNVLFAWLQINEEEAEASREWFARQTADDRQMLRLLNRMRSWRGTADGSLYPINRDVIEHFGDFDALMTRVQTLTNSNDEATKELAQAVLDGMRLGIRRR